MAAAVADAHVRFGSNTEGRNSQIYPALAQARSDAFGVCVAGTSGRLYAAGDTDVQFAIMSVSKPFVFAMVCEAIGAERVRHTIGVNGTGLPFNSVEAVYRGDGRTNPMVNAGAIASTCLIPGADVEERWTAIHAGLCGFAGRVLVIDEEIRRSVNETNTQNRTIAAALAERGLLVADADAEQAVELYTRQCVLGVTAVDLAVMGATLADGGVNPLTGERVVGADACRHTLAVMTTAGLYENSGDWFYDVGLPGKSGIGGGIVTVSPGKGGLGTYAPPLDEAGNSVKGQLAARFLSQRLGLDLLASRPAQDPPG